MAKVFKFTDGTNTLDLSNSTGFQLMQEYRPQVAIPPGDGSIPEYISETVPVTINNSGGDNLAGFMQTFHALQKRAAEYWKDPTQGTPVWWHQKLDDETGERRALVKSLEFRTDFNWFGDYPDLEDGVDASLIVERHPYWERTSGVSFPAQTALAGASVMYDYTSSADVVGDVGARVNEFQLRGGGDDLGRVWIGLRSEKHGTVGNFVNIWECEDTDATLGTDAARTTDSSASPGGAGNTKVTVTPGTATWEKRLTIQLADVTANESDNFGIFLWLLRAKVDASTTWEVKFKFGMYADNDANMTEADVIEIDSTSWEYYEMGIQKIPFRDLRSLTTTRYDDTYDGGFEIEIWARRTAGSGILHLDCICPIPVDEGFLYLSSGSNSVLWFAYSESPSGIKQVNAFKTGNYFQSGSLPSDHKFYLPPGDGRMIIVYSDTGSADITEQILVSASTGEWFPRWLSLRGSE